MPLKTIVKVSHISNLSDARYCAGMGVDMLGFQVIPGTNDYMPPQRFQDIRGWISGPAIVAEVYGLTSAAEITSVIETYAPDHLELSFTDFQKFRQDLPLPCIVHFSPNEMASVKGDENIAYLLVGSGTHCEDIAGARFPVLSSVASLEQLNEKLSAGCFKGYVLQGPQEARPGVTNYEQLGSILEALEED